MKIAASTSSSPTGTTSKNKKTNSRSKRESDAETYFNFKSDKFGKEDMTTAKCIILIVIKSYKEDSTNIFSFYTFQAYTLRLTLCAGVHRR